MIKMAVCDDIPEVGSFFKNIIEGHQFMDKVAVDIFTSGEKLYENAVKKRYDMIFMDMELVPGEESAENGMELSNRIKEVYQDVLMIFFTGSLIDTKLLLSFEPFRFIEKPIKEEEVYNVVAAGIKRINNWEDKFFKYKIGQCWSQIDIKQIIYFSSRRPYIEIHTIYENFEFRGKMDDIEKTIKKTTDFFVRVNKSVLVNKNYIRNLSSREVILTNGEEIFIGRKHKKDLSEL